MMMMIMMMMTVVVVAMVVRPSTLSKWRPSLDIYSLLESLDSNWDRCNEWCYITVS